MVVLVIVGVLVLGLVLVRVTGFCSRSFPAPAFVLVFGLVPVLVLVPVPVLVSVLPGDALHHVGLRGGASRFIPGLQHH